MDSAQAKPTLIYSTHARIQMKKLRRYVLAACILAPARARAQTPVPASPTVALSTGGIFGKDTYSLHFQSTVIDQGHYGIHSPYVGAHSFLPTNEQAVSVTATFFAAWRPFDGMTLVMNPELSGGQGMSGALGIAGFPNGETYRIGNPQPVVKTARLYVQQVIGLEGGSERVEDGLNQVAGAVPDHRLTLIAGKFGLMDWFDNNAYSHDPRSQFMNWALANSSAWDYPADTFGYTWGFIAEYHAPEWALRAGAAAEPKAANQVDMDRRLAQAHGLSLEAERQIRLGARKGTARFLIFDNEARMGNYDQAVALGRRLGATPDVTQTGDYAHHKFGFTSSDDLELRDNLGGFMRLSWDDGKNETWAYDEVDGSLAVGVDWVPARWGRPNDHWGTAEVVNVLSGPHRRYLAAGGLGFMLGDGALHYFA